MTSPKIAIVYSRTNSEEYIDTVLRGLSEAFPSATIYAPPRPSRLQQRLQSLFPKRQLQWFRQLDLSAFDIIISCGDSLTKHVKKANDNQTHIHYGHIPTPIPSLKNTDYEAAQNIDFFIATSSNAQQRIKTFYNKPSTIVHPPFDTSLFTPARTRSSYYMMIGHHTLDDQAIVAAASKLGIELKVFPENSDASTIRHALNSTKGLISASVSDFNIRQVEALAAGAPVIAYHPDDKSDIIQDNESGILFHEQTIEAIATALQSAENMTFLPGTLRRKAKRFDKGLFVTKLRKIVGDELMKTSLRR